MVEEDPIVGLVGSSRLREGRVARPVRPEAADLLARRMAITRAL